MKKDPQEGTAPSALPRTPLLGCAQAQAERLPLQRLEATIEGLEWAWGGGRWGGGFRVGAPIMKQRTDGWKITRLITQLADPHPNPNKWVWLFLGNPQNGKLCFPLGRFLRRPEKSFPPKRATDAPPPPVPGTPPRCWPPARRRSGAAEGPAPGAARSAPKPRTPPPPPWTAERSGRNKKKTASPPPPRGSRFHVSSCSSRPYMKLQGGLPQCHLQRGAASLNGF